MRSRRTLKMKKGYAVGELAQFFVTGPTDATNKFSDFYCRLCRKDVLFLTQGGYEIIRNLQGHRHFARSQRLRRRTTGWRVLDFDGNPVPKTNLRDSERRLHSPPPFCSPGARISIPGRPDSGYVQKVDPQFTMLANVLCFVDAFQVGGSYKLVPNL